MRITFFTKYTYKGPSSRYRVYQYLEYFKKEGIEVIVEPFFDDEYIDKIYKKEGVSFLYLFVRYFTRFLKVLTLTKIDRIYIEYELLSYFPAWLEKWLKFRKIHYVVDYDDAIQHNYDQNKSFLIRTFLSNKISTVISKAHTVITGSVYLTKFASKYNSSVLEIPTSVDISKYELHQKDTLKQEETFVIGWIGSPSTSVNVLKMLPAFEAFSSKKKSLLLLVGFDKLLLKNFEHLNVEVREWDEIHEVDWIKSFDVGIMPLEDTAFNRGKCGFKLIQYMAAGIPTISSPLPANININRSRKNLFATTTAEWIAAFEEVYENKDYYKKIVGVENKQIVSKYYSTQSNSKKFVDIFKSIPS